jgi:hypothetical protein
MLEVRAGLGKEIMAEILQGIKARKWQEDKVRILTGEKGKIQEVEKDKTHVGVIGRK